MNNRGCHLARILNLDDCDGYLQAAHWVPKQRLKHVFKQRGYTAQRIAQLIWVPCLTSPSCERHHSAFDRKLPGFRLTEEEYPQAFRDWCADNGFEFRGPRDGWVGIHVEDQGPEAA